MKLYTKKIFVTLIALTFIFSFSTSAQNKSVPLDPEVRFGKLENGLTYYIKHNEKPENRAEFYLVNDVGAILETDAQNGLAHFCEHMSFNGTVNFPGKGILNYFETVGMQFGRNINAGTGIDMTYYLLMQTPVTREGIIDTALLSIKDISHNVLFSNEEIDNERGVIHEEWRTTRNADFRLNSVINPIIYQGSKYAKRDIIGELDVIDNCPYDTLRQFYKDWYRTDLQALVIVGDIDVDQIESKIREYFSSIPAQETPKARPVFSIPDNDKPIIAIATDKEAQNTSIRVYYKHNYVEPENKDMQYYLASFKEELYTNMLNERFNELVQKENPPFINAYNFYGKFAGDKDAYVLGAFANNNVKYGLKTILIENKRVVQFGFTESELERTKADMLRNLEKQFKEKDQQQNRTLAFQYATHFISNSATPGITYEYELAKKIIPEISLQEVNDLTQQWVSEKNMVITITGPEKEDIEIPTEDEVQAILNEIKSTNVDAYVDKVSDKPLIEKLPAPGKVVNEEFNKDLSANVWQLSNGVKVILKATDFKEDEILINAFSKGGTSLYSVEDLPSAEFASIIANKSGISGFSLIELQKMLTGKVVSVNPYIDELYEGFNGNAAPNDFETALQLIHLYFTNPRFDETATNAYLERYKAFLQNKALNPDAVFGDTISYLLSDRNLRKHPLDVDKLNKINFEKAKEIYSDRFADASDFTFVFVGNIDIEKVKPLIENYLGSLPSLKRNENWKDNNVRHPKGKVEKTIEKDLEVAKSSVFVNLNGNFNYNLENRLLLQTIKHVLEIVYIETIREDEGGTYGASVWVTSSEYPVQIFDLNIAFDCDNEKADKLKTIVYEEIENMVKNGPSEENLNKAKENFLKNRENNLKENNFWLSSIVSNLQHDENTLDNEMYESLVKSITIEKVRKAAEELLTQGNNIEVIMQPIKK